MKKISACSFPLVSCFIVICCCRISLWISQDIIRRLCSHQHGCHWQRPRHRIKMKKKKNARRRKVTQRDFPLLQWYWADCLVRFFSFRVSLDLQRFLCAGHSRQCQRRRVSSIYSNTSRDGSNEISENVSCWLFCQEAKHALWRHKNLLKNPSPPTANDVIKARRNAEMGETNENANKSFSVVAFWLSNATSKSKTTKWYICIGFLYSNKWTSLKSNLWARSEGNGTTKNENYYMLKWNKRKMVFTSANSAFAVGCGWTLFWFFCHNGQGELCRIGVEAGPVDAVNNGISYCGINLRWAIKSNEYYMSEKRGSWYSRNVAPKTHQIAHKPKRLLTDWYYYGYLNIGIFFGGEARASVSQAMPSHNKCCKSP